MNRPGSACRIATPAIDNRPGERAQRLAPVPRVREASQSEREPGIGEEEDQARSDPDDPMKELDNPRRLNKLRVAYRGRVQASLRGFTHPPAGADTRFPSAAT